jgi:hypothetical protein
VNYLEAEAI